MAHNISKFRSESQPSYSDKHPVYYLNGRLHTNATAGDKKMLQAKWIVADIFGFSAAFLGWINNLDTVKSTLLFIVGFTYALARLYFYVRKGLYDIRKQNREEQDWNNKKSA